MYANRAPHTLLLCKNNDKHMLFFHLPVIYITTRERCAERPNNRIVTNTKKNYIVACIETFSCFHALCILPEWKCHKSTNLLVAAYFCKYKQGNLEII